MTADKPQANPAAQADSREELSETVEAFAEVESGPRHPAHWLPAILILALCIAWSLFQLYHAQYPLTAKVARYIHLSFALALAFLAYPAIKHPLEAAPVRDWRRYFIWRGVLLGVAAVAAGVIFEDPVPGFFVFAALIAIFSVIGLLLAAPSRRHIVLGVLLLLIGVLIWSNMAGISAGLSRPGFPGGLAPILAYVLAAGAIIEGLRRIAAGLYRFANPDVATVPETGWRRVFGLGMSRSVRTVIPVYDYIFALIAVGCTLYLVYDFDKITEAGGLVDEPQQLIFAIILILLLLEAARRSLGMPLMVLSLVFIVYALYPSLEAGRSFGVPALDGVFGAVLPPLRDFINPPIQPLSQIAGEMYLTDTSIFGVPLDVSVSFVFLFVLFGALLDRAGAGKYFIDVAFAGLGSQRAGPAKAAIVASGATGLVSGSSIANTVTTGTFTIPLMKKVGLPAYKAGAVEVAASTNGQLMPPIMGAAAFIMAEIIGMKYIDIVRAAFLPAIISYLALFYVVHLEALKLGIKSIPKSELPPFLKTFLRGMHYLVPLLVLIYFLIVVRRSPIQSAVYAIAALVVLMIIQRPIIAYLGLGAQRRAGTLDPAASLSVELGRAFVAGIQDIVSGLISGARNMISVGIATGTAGIIVGIVTITGLTGRLVTIINTLALGNIVLVLILTAVTSIILGMGLPTTVNYILMASLTAPVILQIGEAQHLIFPIIAAHLFVFYFGILADDTPPVGLAAYAAAAIARADPIKTGIQGFTYDMRTAILPFVFVFNNEMLMMAGTDPKKMPIWIDNVFLIVYVFMMALAAMCVFAAFLQGYFADRCGWPTRLFLLGCAALMFVPNVVAEALGFTGDGLEVAKRAIQVAGFVAAAGVYFLQRARLRLRPQAENA